MPKIDKSEKQLLEEINDKLNTLVGLNAIQGKQKVDQIKILASMGFTNAEISKITGIPKGTVDTTRARKK
jgi:hypothetical protein